MARLGERTGNVVRRTRVCDWGLDTARKSGIVVSEMRLNIPRINKVKNILPMFSGDYTIDIVNVKDDVIVSSVKPSEVTGDSNNEIIHLGWTDDISGKLYMVKFTEENVSKSILDDHNLVMENTEGDLLTLHFS